MHCRDLFSGVLVGLAFILLTACGGGSSGGSSSPPPAGTAAPSGLSYPTPQVLTVRQAVTGISPTVTGSVTSYSASPPVPFGLALNTSTGVISGTPTALTAAASYTVTATNSGGSTTAQVSITVNDVAPTLTYSSSATIAVATGIPIVRIAPVTTGGAITSWSVNPALPAGLTLNQDGSITGTPTTAAAVAAYTVTAANSGGQSTFALNLSVQSGTLLDLGHADSVSAMRFDGTHVVSEDVTGHWALWNYATGSLIASGDSGCSPAACQHGFGANVTGSIAVVQIPTGFELRSAADGHVIATIPFGAWSWNIAADGSYFCAQGPSGLAAWNTSGTPLLSRSGDYSNASVYASPTEILVASGAAGSNAVETINVASAVSVIGPAFSGAFGSWFADGGHFSTALGSTALIYSKASVQQEVATLSTGTGAGVGGTGNWFYQAGTNTINIYAIGGSNTPVASFPIGSTLVALTPSATSLGVLVTNSVGVIDLSGATPVETNFTLPIAGSTVYAASSAAHWLVGNQFGVVLDGAGLPATPRYFDYGQAWSFAGSSSLLAIATASGRIVYFDSASLSLQGTVQDFSSKIQLSSDGTVLAAMGNALQAQYNPDWSLNVYSLPSNAALAHWPYTLTAPPTTPVPVDIALSGSGTVLAQLLTNSRQVSGITPASNVIWSDTQGSETFDLEAQVRLSPDGTLIAAETGTGVVSDGANILKNGVLTTAVNGWPVGWLDDNRLMTNIYDPNAPHTDASPYRHAAIYDATGAVVATSPIVELHEFQALAADSIYSDEKNSIFAVSTGDVTWTSDDVTRGKGAVAGSYVVFSSGARVLALSH